MSPKDRARAEELAKELAFPPVYHSLADDSIPELVAADFPKVIG